MSQNATPLSRIIFLVLLCHLAALWMLLSITPPESVLPPPQRLVVQTMKLSPPKIIKKEKPMEPLAEAPPAAIAMEEKPQIESPPPPPKKEPTPPPAPPPTPKEKPAPKKTLPPKPKKKPATPAKKTAPAPPKPTPKPSPEKKPPQKKKELKLPPAPPPIDPAKEAAKAKQKNLLAEAKQRMGALQTATPAKTSSKIAPEIASLDFSSIKNVEISSSVAAVNSMERSYRDELAARLKLKLTLPEEGEATLKLTLNRSGKVLKLSVLKSNSPANTSYIESSVPLLSYPSFGNNFPDQAECTFTITLSSE